LLFRRASNPRFSLVPQELPTQLELPYPSAKPAEAFELVATLPWLLKGNYMEIIRATEGNLVPSRSKLVYSRYTKKGW
jgi:hypothetical protein